MYMYPFALMFFLLGAAIGVAMLVNHFRQRKIPFPLAATHGVFILLGFLFLIAGLLQNVNGLLLTAFAFFLVVAIGGLMMFFGHYRKKERLPSGLVVGHAMGAILAIVALTLGWLTLGL